VIVNPQTNVEPRVSYIHMLDIAFDIVFDRGPKGPPGPFSRAFLVHVSLSSPLLLDRLDNVIASDVKRQGRGGGGEGPARARARALQHTSLFGPIEGAREHSRHVTREGEDRKPSGNPSIDLGAQLRVGVIWRQASGRPAGHFSKA